MALKYDVPMEEIVQQLQGIREMDPVWNTIDGVDGESVQVHGIADGVAYALKEWRSVAPESKDEEAERGQLVLYRHRFRFRRYPRNVGDWSHRIFGWSDRDVVEWRRIFEREFICAFCGKFSLEINEVPVVTDGPFIKLVLSCSSQCAMALAAFRDQDDEA